jgi:hypothetical protein
LRVQNGEPIVAGKPKVFATWGPRQTAYLFFKKIRLVPFLRKDHPGQTHLLFHIIDEKGILSLVKKSKPATIGGPDNLGTVSIKGEKGGKHHLSLSLVILFVGRQLW